ncbi:MAG: hypothetical protein LKE96_03715 [Acetobacter peroxydans]|jgi:hypothetical protein|nr:hypothetical protein [Acetobacter peroxydans]MCI2008942.1 hypothetical protein [Acetobacter peroxydans]MCI2077876.1 hypothetical protein [Acetobacter peroxydans]
MSMPLGLVNRLRGGVGCVDLYPALWGRPQGGLPGIRVLIVRPARGLGLSGVAPEGFLRLGLAQFQPCQFLWMIEPSHAAID